MSLLTLFDSGDSSRFEFQFNERLTALPPSLVRLGATYTRNSLKNVLQDGALVSLSANVFGTSFDPVESKFAYMPEPAATNLLQNSGLTGGAAAPTNWTQSVGTGTSAPATSTYNPNGTAYSQSATAERPFINQTISVSANTVYSLQIYIESISAGLKSSDCLSFATFPAGATLTYPACQANTAGGTGNNITTGLLVATLTVAATAGTAVCRSGLGCNGAITGTIRFSSPQAESGTRATSWILTPVGGTAARAADVLSIPTANIAGFTSSAYTLFADCRADVIPPAARYLSSVNDTSTNNRLSIYRDATTASDISVTGGATQANQTIATTILTRSKIASSATANNFLLSHNGTGAAADTSGTMPTSPTTFDIGQEIAASQFNSYIYSATLYTRALTQAQLNAITL